MDIEGIAWIGTRIDDGGGPAGLWIIRLAATGDKGTDGCQNPLGGRRSLRRLGNERASATYRRDRSVRRSQRDPVSTLESPSERSRTSSALWSRPSCRPWRSPARPAVPVSHPGWQFPCDIARSCATIPLATFQGSSVSGQSVRRNPTEEVPHVSRFAGYAFAEPGWRLGRQCSCFGPSEPTWAMLPSRAGQMSNGPGRPGAAFAPGRRSPASPAVSPGRSARRKQ
jgi:hypothetical protein